MGGEEGSAGGERGTVVGNGDAFDQMIISMYEILNKKIVPREMKR